MSSSFQCCNRVLKIFNNTHNKKSKNQSCFGFSFIDVIIGTALVTIVFSGIFGLLQLGAKVIERSKAKITALSIANEKIEYARSLPYESVGVIGGYPDGILETSTTTIRNNILYTIDTRVDYVIDSTDGIASPEDECPNDYKKLQVTVSWAGREEGEISLSTDIIPDTLAQECAEEGGILFVSVFDAYGLMVQAPLIEVKNPETDETIKTATPTDGEHYFSLPTSTYKVVVSKSGFSTDRTYGTDEVATPAKPHPMVFEKKTTEISFSIDETSTFSIDTSSPWGEDYFYDSFSDTNKISESNNIEVSEGQVSLKRNQGTYFMDGTTDDNLCFFPGNSGDCAQSFTMGSGNKQISQIKLYLRKATTTPSDIYLEIRTSSTTGPLLASSTVVTGSNLPVNLEWVDFNFSSPITLSAGTKYFLRLRSIPDSVENEAKGPIHWGYLYSTASPPGYQEGEAFRYVGLNQETLTDYDFSFRIYDDEYSSSGYLVSNEINPSELVNWNELSWTDSESLNTDLKYQIYYASGTEWLLIPDSDLTGNSSGFDVSPLDLSSLNITDYPKLKIKGNLSTSDPNSSPILYDWQISWINSSSTPIPNVSFLVTGQKTIGTDVNEDPVYKYSATSTSDSNGHVDIPNMEWDFYTFSVSQPNGLDLISTDPAPQPINLLPDNTIQHVILYLEANNSALIYVQNKDTLEPVFSASVRLYNTGLGYDVTQYTNEKGQAYFIPLETDTYNIEVSAPGYLNVTDTISVSGDETKTIRLEQIE